ncbi:MAG: hypothetical protein ACHQNE_03285 [Candidatus Kapaibacterium sp.]
MRNSILFFMLAAGLSVCSCGKKDSGSPVTPPDTTVTKKLDTVALAQWGTIVQDTSIFYRGTQIGKITDPTMASASGIAASRAYPGMLWIENDQGGGTNNIYLVDSTGAKRAVFSVTGATDRDWTDMGIGPGPVAGMNYIYIADIGDSKPNHPTSYIYRFPEPQAPLISGVLTGATAPADKITFDYPNGPRDAETILIDPISKDLYIVDKYGASDVFYLPYPQSTDTTIKAKEIIEYMPVPDGPLRSGGIASNRSEILMKSYTSIYCWKIAASESILNALLTTPVIIPIIPEVQGEAMCYTPDDNEFWTTSKFSTLNYADLTRYVRR